jgi:UDP-N-acetylmuramate dehydrogenase
MDAISRAIDAVRSERLDAEILLDEPLKNHTSFKIGGPVNVMLFPKDSDCLVKLLNILGEFGVIPLILGNGTNILASDERIEMLAINTTKLNNVKMTATDNRVLKESVEITAEAGALLSKLAVFAYEQELTGLEFAHGIPGTLGGAVVMNAGAYGGEMVDVIHSTTAYSLEMGLYTVANPEHEFSYRHSRFSNSSDVIISSVLRLAKGDKETIKKKMDEFKTRRQESQPLDIPSAGSTFKRPAEGYAAAYIEKAGLKGCSIGGAAVSEKHAGFIVNNSSASFTDTMALTQHVREVVLKQFGVELEPEVRVIS